MKVLLVHSRYRSAAPSGENIVVDAEAALLADVGHEVAKWERHSDDIATWPAARKALLPALSVRNPEVRRALTAHLRAERPDVVHLHNTFPMLSPSVLEACAAVGVPVVMTLHNYKLLCASGDFFRDGAPCHDCASGAVRPGIVHGCYRGSRLATLPVAAGLLANRATWRRLVSAYIFVSASQRDLLAGLELPPERLFVKHNFVATRPVHDHREHRVTYLGRLDAAKGVPVLLRAWDRFRAARPGSALRLAIAGDGVLGPEVRRWAAGHTSVDVHPHLTRAEAADLVAGSIAAVVPSAWEESFGLVAVEAMAAAVAPLVPDRGSFPQLVTDGVDGVHVRSGDDQDLARALAEVDSDPARFLTLGLRARQTCERRFHPVANLEDLLAVYRFALAHPVTMQPTREGVGP